MSQQFPSTSLVHTLTKNTLLNLFSQGIYLALAFWGIPIIISGLGPEQFGLLALIWAVIGYFTLLDFGISRAITKFIAEIRETNDSILEHKIIWTSIFTTLIIGLISGLCVFIFSQFAVDHFLNIDVRYRPEALKMFKVTALGVPFMLLYGTLKGFQMAIQRFDQVNLIQIAVGIVQWVGSILLLQFQYGLYEIVVLTIGSRIVFMIIAAISMLKIYPGFYQSFQFIDRVTFRKLWSFGGWVFISQIISPLYLYIDRIFIAMFLTLSAVAYYSIPQETLSRLLIITMSFTTTLFPAMSAQAASEINNKIARALYLRSMKYLIAVSVPATICFIIYAQEIVQLWLGRDFAEKTVHIFQILSVGLLFNSIAQIPNTVLQAYDRPDIPAKFHVIELPIVIALNVILIPLIGVIGAAVAWSSRVIIDSILHIVAVNTRIKHLTMNRNVYVSLFLVCLSIVIVSAIVLLIYSTQDPVFKLSMTIVLIGVYSLSLWQYGFDEVDKKYILGLVKIG